MADWGISRESQRFPGVCACPRPVPHDQPTFPSLDADGAIDWDLWCIDGSSMQASRAAAGASKKAAAVTRTSRKTTLWAAREAVSAASSTWFLTVEVTAGQVHTGDLQKLCCTTRIGTRFEKLAINFLAMMKLVMIQRCLKIAFSDRA